MEAEGMDSLSFEVNTLSIDMHGAVIRKVTYVWFVCNRLCRFVWNLDLRWFVTMWLSACSCVPYCCHPWSWFGNVMWLKIPVLLSSWCNWKMCSTAQNNRSLKSLYLSEVSLLYLCAVCVNHFELELSFGTKEEVWIESFRRLTSSHSQLCLAVCLQLNGSFLSDKKMGKWQRQDLDNVFNQVG